MTDLLDLADRLEAACDITGKPSGRHMVPGMTKLAEMQIAMGANADDREAGELGEVTAFMTSCIDAEAKLFDALAIVAKEAVEALPAVESERAFLLARSAKAGSFSLSGGRWTGASSNALVTVAFGGEDGCLPYDGDDLAACYRTIMRMPAHLVSDAVMDQLHRGEQKLSSEGVAWAREASGWLERQAPCIRVYQSDGAIPS